MNNCAHSIWTPRAAGRRWAAANRRSACWAARKTAAALGDTQIILPGGKSVRLREIADVRDGIAEVRSIARLNGRPATTFGVFKAKGASDVGRGQGGEGRTRQDQGARIPPCT